MQGSAGVDQELMDARALVGHLVPAGSVFGFLAEHRGEVFPAGLFEDLFPSSTGRPSLPGEVAASGLVLQALHGLSDRDAVLAVRCETTGTATCPNGVTRRITASRAVTFGAACRGCPLRARCTTSKTGRTLNLHPRAAELRQARRDW